MKKLALIIAVIFIAACSKTGIETNSALSSVKKMGGMRIWHGTYSNGNPLNDTFYYFSDSFAISIISDSIIKARDITLKVVQIDTAQQAILFMGIAGDPSPFHSHDIWYYYQRDSIVYNQNLLPGHVSWTIYISMHTP